MKRAVHLAWSLIRIRHLATSLFMLPLVCSVLLVFAQLALTSAFIRAVVPGAADEGSVEPVIQEDFNPVRLVLYGSSEPRPNLQVCRWIVNPSDPTKEVPPRPSCAADSLDVAVHVSNPSSFDASNLAEMFRGQIDRLHICRNCRLDIVINVSEDGRHVTRAENVYGLAVLSLAYMPKPEDRFEQIDSFRIAEQGIGTLFFYMPDASSLVQITGDNGAMLFTANVVTLVVIALWLAVRAHRKVLDYFARNDVLLPLVAATGKHTFYSALWIVTGARVLCFLAASIPVIYFGLSDIGGDDVFDPLVEHIDLIVVWLFTLVSAVSLCTVISSIAELKHRQALRSFLYRYVPIIGALFGGCMWVGSFVLPSQSMGIVRSVITSLPVIGLAPLFVVPITLPNVFVVLLHGVVSAVLVVFILRKNARWFGAHLEEV